MLECIRLTKLMDRGVVSVEVYIGLAFRPEMPDINLSFSRSAPGPYTMPFSIPSFPLLLSLRTGSIPKSQSPNYHLSPTSLANDLRNVTSRSKITRE